MSNFRRGKKFETILKRKLIDKGFRVLKLAIPETADLILINKYPVLLECKVSQSPIWYRKNNKQFERLTRYMVEGYSVFIVVKFISKPPIIRFFKLLDEYPFRVQNGLSLNEFIALLNGEVK